MSTFASQIDCVHLRQVRLFFSVAEQAPKVWFRVIASCKYQAFVIFYTPFERTCLEAAWDISRVPCYHLRHETT